MRDVIKLSCSRWQLNALRLSAMAILGVSSCSFAFDDSMFSSVGPEDQAQSEELYLGWHGALNMTFGFAPQSHNVEGFNRNDTGYTEELYLLKLNREWEFSDVFTLAIGGLVDARFYHDQPRSESVPKDQYKESNLWIRPQETYLQWNISENIWARHGYYTVSFGMSDAFDVMDKLTPRDNSRWGQELSSDSREPLHLSQLTWDLSVAKVGLTTSHKFQGNRLGLAGSDYDAFVEIRAGGARVNAPLKPADFKTEWVIDAKGTFPSGDWALLGGEIYNKNASLVYEGFYPRISQPVYSLKYTRTAIAGGGVDYVTGAVVWKGEAVWLDDYDEMASPGQESVDGKVSQLQYLIGADYTASGNMIISLETKFSKLQGQYAIDKSTYDEISIQVMKNWLNDQVFTQFRFSTRPKNTGHFYQLMVAYDLSDHWNIEGKYTDYVKTSSQNYFSRFENSDRFLLSANFSF